MATATATAIEALLAGHELCSAPECLSEHRLGVGKRRGAFIVEQGNEQDGAGWEGQAGTGLLPSRG